MRDERGRIRLDVIDVVEPCTEDWGAMRGDERVRFCDLCHRNVFDLSAMTRADAEALVSEHEGRLCVRFYRRADGTVTTSDCAPDRLARLRRGAKKSLAFAAVATAGLMTLVGALGAATALGAFAEEMNEPDPTEIPMMGVAPYVEPPPEDVTDPPADDEPQIVPSDETSEEARGR